MNKLWRNIVVCLLVAVVFLTPTSAIINEDSRQDNIYREVIIKFTEGKSINSPNIKKLNEKYHICSIEKVFTNCEGTSLDNIYLLLVPEKSNINVIIKDYLSLPDVEYAEPNYVRNTISLATSNHQGKNSDVQKVYPYLNQMDIPNDPDFAKQWSLDNTGQTGGSPDADIDAPEAWEIETGNPEIVIAIVDSGIDYTHPDLAGNIWINNDEIPDNDIDDDNNGFVDDYYGYDFTERGDPDPIDTMGHGTHCAGIAGAVTNNNIGIAGVCWNCKLMPVRVFTNESAAWSWVVNGIKYAADNGAHVISMSFGWYDPADVLKDAIDYAYGKGAVLVAAAGNEGVMSKLYPAGYENVIAVAATDHNDQRMNLYEENLDREIVSNFGFWVDVAAPGQNIYSTTPTYNYYFGDEYGFEQDYDYFTGTSMATPHVAGIVGLLLSNNQSLSQDEIKTLIRKNVNPYRSIYYLGTGRVNAHKAIKNIEDISQHILTGEILKKIIENSHLINKPLVKYLQGHTRLLPLLRQLVKL